MAKSQIYHFFLVNPGPRPPFGQVAEHLCGEDCSFDSEGNSYPDPKTTAWTWLWMESRELDDQMVNIQPLEEKSGLVLAVSSKDRELALRTVTFLQREAGGELRDSWPLPDGWEPWGIVSD